jgi:peptide-methionine (S)-S-oxide reductase
VATLAGGCFWCLEGPLEAVRGVGEVYSGYTGGALEHVTYQQIGRGDTGHVEAVRVVYDPTQVTYAQLLDVFVHNIDPTQDDGQFCDRGAQYRSAIFVANSEERAAANEALRAAGARLGVRVVTEVRDAGPFWLAEDYHQDFYRTHAAHYQRYRAGCGRDARLEALWGSSAH